MQCHKVHVKRQQPIAVLMVNAALHCCLKLVQQQHYSMFVAYSLPLGEVTRAKLQGITVTPSCVSHARLAYRECHLSNAIEEHLQGGKEEKTRIQVCIVNAVWGNVSAKEQRRTDDACKGCLQQPAINVSCNSPLKRASPIRMTTLL